MASRCAWTRATRVCVKREASIGIEQVIVSAYSTYPEGVSICILGRLRALALAVARSNAQRSRSHAWMRRSFVYHVAR